MRQNHRCSIWRPTNTYLAYGNERLFGGIESAPDFIERSVSDPIEMTERDYFLMEHPEIGSSVYDLHPDHTVICYSSRLRPMVTMRPEASVLDHWPPAAFQRRSLSHRVARIHGL